MSASSLSTLSSAPSVSSSLEQEEIVAHFQELASNFLGNAEFDKDFFAVPDGKDAKNLKFELSEGVPFRFHVYGILLPQSMGTKINAAGNYNGGEAAYFRPLRDANDMGRLVKDVHAIAVPSWAISKMKAQINNSIATLNMVDDGVKKLDGIKGLQSPVNTYDWVKSSNGEEVDIILIQSSNKYGKPPVNENISSTAIRRTAKVDLEDPEQSSANETDANTSAKRVGKPGAWYDPNVQTDFGGPFFDIRGDKLKQQNVHDIDGDLIHPADVYDVLRPGTLIEYICHLHVFNITNKNSKTPGYNRYYQIQFDEAHTLLESDEPACQRIRPEVPIEYATLLNNTAPRATSGRVKEMQTYAQKKRASQRLKTIHSESSSTSTSTSSAPTGTNTQKLSKPNAIGTKPRSTTTASTSSTQKAANTRAKNPPISEKAKGKRKEIQEDDGEMNCD